MIKLKEVSKAYNKKNVFEDVNLKLELVSYRRL